MARKRKAQRKVEVLGPIATFERNQRVANDQDALNVITAAQAAKGTYVGSRSQLVAIHDPVMRWERAGKLTQAQGVAISLVRRLWSLAGLQQRVTASYGEKTAGGGCSERMAINEIEAREDLHRIQDYVPAPYWHIFEAVCRWGEAAGVAGSSLGYGDRAAETRAHQIVVFVADVIAMKERV